MQSPFTGKEMKISIEKVSLTFRKETFNVFFHTYLCEDTNQKFESTDFANLNINQLYNQYREKHNIPFPTEIKAIREQYKIPSAAMMSSILGFGTNMYANYEIGEIPSISNANLIDLARNPQSFKSLVEKADIKLKDKKKIFSQIEEIAVELAEKEKLFEKLELNTKPTLSNGYSVPKIEKINKLILFFAGKLQPYKTALNKLLFYADFWHFKDTGFSITGLTYQAYPFGIVPSNYEGIFREIEEKNKNLHIERALNAEGTAVKERYTIQEQETSIDDFFSNKELEIINKVIATFKGKTATEIVRENHKEEAWRENESDKKIVNYEYAFKLNSSLFVAPVV